MMGADRKEVLVRVPITVDGELVELCHAECVGMDPDGQDGGKCLLFRRDNGDSRELEAADDGVRWFRCRKCMSNEGK
jgi:hypothetical protein